MRADILLAIVCLFVPVALAMPKWGLVGYMFFALCRPDIMAWAATDRASLILAAATLLGSAIYIGRWFAQLRNPLVLTLLFLILMFFLSTVLAVVPGLAYPRFNGFFRGSILALAIPVLFKTEEDLSCGILGIVAGLGVIGVKFGLYSVGHGGLRYNSGYGGMLGDNNTLALGLVMAVPLAYYGLRMVQRNWARVSVLGLLIFLIVTAIMTYSRGAALSLGVVMLMILRGSKHKVTAVVLVAILGMPAAWLVGRSYFDRVRSIGNYATDVSIRDRLANAATAVLVWKDYPIHGVGFGMENQALIFRNYISEGDLGYGLVVHNTYLQLLTDSGLVGFVPYVMLLFGTIWWLGRSAKRTARVWPGKEIYPKALQCSLMACAVGTIFLSRVDFDLTYMVLMCSAAWWNLVRTQTRNAAPAAVPFRPASRIAHVGRMQPQSMAVAPRV